MRGKVRIGWFDAIDIEVMVTALEAAWNFMRIEAGPATILSRSGQARRYLARRIVQCYQQGETSYGGLLRFALAELVDDRRPAA